MQQEKRAAFPLEISQWADGQKCTVVDYMLVEFSVVPLGLERV